MTTRTLFKSLLAALGDFFLESDKELKKTLERKNRYGIA